MNVLACGGRIRRFGAVAGLVLFAAAPGSAAPPDGEKAPGAEAEAERRLAAMNEIFRAAYKRARAETLAQAGPVILVHHEQLTLIRGSERNVATVDFGPYQKLKALAHVPLALFTMLVPYPEGTIPEERLGRLQDERQAIVETLAILNSCGFTPDQLGRQRELLRRCLGFLEPVLARRQSRRDELDAFARSVGPIVLANAADAAAAQIEAYHAQVTEWRKRLGPEAWDRVRVVVIGRQLPRKANIASQYFARLLDVPGEGPRLSYAEELSGDDAALDLLGSRLLDRSVARAFFGDPERMERDLLADGARAYLGWRDLGR